MSRDDGSERGQRTVAELLAEYGGSANAPRRRRRRAEDDEDSAPQTIIERVLSDSGKLLPVRDDPPTEHDGQAKARPAERHAEPGPTAYAEPVRPPNGAPGGRP